MWYHVLGEQISREWHRCAAPCMSRETTGRSVRGCAHGMRIGSSVPQPDSVLRRESRPMVTETRIIAAAFPNAKDAQDAVLALKQGGFAEQDISLLYTDAGHTIRAGLLDGAIWGGV